MKRLHLFALLLGAFTSSSSAFSASDTELAAYASLLTMAQEAEKNCPNTYASDAAILILKEANHITEKDDRTLKSEFSKSKAAIQREISTGGTAKWCKTILELYGPKGRVQNILITR